MGLFVQSRNALPLVLITLTSIVVRGSNYFQDFDITWGGDRGKIVNNGELLTLSLDTSSGSGFQSKKEYLFGKIDMQIKLVPGNSAGTVTAYYVFPVSFYFRLFIHFHFLARVLACELKYEYLQITRSY